MGYGSKRRHDGKQLLVRAQAMMWGVPGKRCRSLAVHYKEASIKVELGGMNVEPGVRESFWRLSSTNAFSSATLSLEVPQLSRTLRGLH